MKKHLILLLLTGLFTFSGCSNDDDTPEETGEPILGTWVLISVNPEFIDVNACPEKSTITFNEDNTGTASVFLESESCEEQTDSGRWENLGNGLYQVDVPFSGTPITSGTVKFEGANNFVFTSSSFEFYFQKQ